jgi:hypothetical protein
MNESHITNYPRNNPFRLAQVEMLIEYCSYAGIDVYAAEASTAWPTEAGLYSRCRADMTDAWQWIEQIPDNDFGIYSSPKRMNHYQGRNYV